MLLRSPFSALIIGPSGSGKSQLILELIKNNSFQCEKIHLFYQNYQPLYDRFPLQRTRFYKYWIENKHSSSIITATNTDNHHHDSLENFIKQITDNGKSPPGINTLVFDDALAFCKLPIFEEIFTRMCHHYNLNVFMTVQNLFDSSLRVISRNTHYLFLFRTPRDSAQVRHLAYQIYPEKVHARAFITTLKNITKTPYRAVLLDFKPDTKEFARVKSHFFPHEGGVVIHCMGDSLPPADYISGNEIDS